MQSDLPDASALEAGILEDSRPSRLSRVQDDVRNLLRGSVLASVRSSIVSNNRANATTTDPQLPNGLPTPPESPLYRREPPPQRPRVVTTPTSIVDMRVMNELSPASTISPVTPVAARRYRDESHHDLLESNSYHDSPQNAAHESAMFNFRALAALDHPDLSDPSLNWLMRAKGESRQRRAWKRSRRPHATRKTKGVETSQCVICVLSAILLAALVATYIALATTSTNVTTTFHVLFILGILLATIVFAYSAVRLCVTSSSASLYSSPSLSRRILIVPESRHGHHRHRHHRPGRLRHTHTESREPLAPRRADNTQPFVPPTPIRVHVESDNELPSSSRAEEANSQRSPAIRTSQENDKVIHPPPAYGRWRESVRADPDLLHWQAVPSPVDSEMSSLPSPTYEEVMATDAAGPSQRTGPPSYATRASPARVREARPPAVEDIEEEASGSKARETVPLGPEMFEVGRGFGIAV